MSTTEQAETEPEDAEVVASQELAVVTATTPVKASDLVDRLATIREAMERAMTRDVDYGIIPGTGSKPTLLKPGAEKLSVLFQLDPQVEHEEKWEGDHLTVTATCIVYHAPSGTRLGRGEGMCSTREKKYAKRRAELTCPECGKENIRRSKNASDGFYCWRKTDGCGAVFPENDERITSQVAGTIDNPDLPDSWNVVLKMARKRALVDGVLLVTGASALFTQDLDDTAVTAPPPEPENRAPFGPAATGNVVPRTSNAIKFLLDGDDVATSKVIANILEKVAKDGKAGDYFPLIVSRSIGVIATELKKKREPLEHAPVLDATEGFGVCTCGWRGQPEDLQEHIDGPGAS